MYLLFAALQRRDGFQDTAFFIRADPLAALAAMLASRAWLGAFVAALATLAAALVVGRVWCGWICPLGTLLGWLRFRRARRRALPPALRRVKYVLLGTIVVMAAFGGLTLMALDPITLLTRTATTSVLPGLVYAVDGVERHLMAWTPATGAVSWLEDHLRGTWLPLTQPRYSQAVGLLLLLLALVLLNAVADRFWCRYLCPLGALLGLAAKVQVLRPLAGAGCDDCGSCQRACRMDAIERSGVGTPRVVTSECIMCLDCLVACSREPRMSLGVARPGPWMEYDPGRREALIAVGGGLGAVVLLGAGVWRAFPRPGLIRPPGAQDESAFLSRCVRCGECMKVCPTSGLQPALAQAGLEGLWTPVLVARLGYCDYACTACGHVCPSGAIPKLGLAEKRRRVLGSAVIDRDRCLPWAQDTPCLVCQEMCPVPRKAILLKGGAKALAAAAEGGPAARPYVRAETCIGCGICETMCPLRGEAAIRVVPASRIPAVGSGETG